MPRHRVWSPRRGCRLGRTHLRHCWIASTSGGCTRRHSSRRRSWSTSSSSPASWTHAWYASADLETRGEEVLLFGPGPAPYWAIAAREYLERWVHHLQIRRALERGPGH